MRLRKGAEREEAPFRHGAIDCFASLAMTVFAAGA